MNPTALTNPFIFPLFWAAANRKCVREKMQQSLYKIRKCVTVWSRIAVVTDRHRTRRAGNGPRGREQHRWANREVEWAGGHESKRGQRTSFKLTTADDRISAYERIVPPASRGQ